MAETSRSVVFMGTTGTGKSTLANSLLGLSVDPRDAGVGASFKMSAGAQSCTLDCSAKDAHWLGNTSKLIRLIDTPGHGDGAGHDHELREAIVRGMKAEKAIHAFIWAKNSESPRVDAQDMEFLEIFRRIFGGAFMKNMIIVFTRFDQSSRAEKRRAINGSSLGSVINEFRRAIGDTNAEIPMFAIDALHDQDDPVSRQKYLESCEALWRTIQMFSETPVEHIQNVKDKIAALNDKLKGMSEEMAANQARHEAEKKQLQLNFEQMQREGQEQLAKLEEERRRKEKEFQEQLKTADETRKQEIIELQQQMANKERDQKEHLANVEKNMKAEMEKARKDQEEQKAQHDAAVADYKSKIDSMQNRVKEPEWWEKALDFVGMFNPLIAGVKGILGK